jgi:hypothetical protein
MRIWLNTRFLSFTLVAAISVAFGAGIYWWKAVPSRPSVSSLTSQTYSFGSVRAGSKLTHNFRLHNNDSKLLKITSIVGSCSCLVPASKPSEIPMQGYIDLPITLSAPDHAGRAGGTVMVQFAEHATIQLKLTADVVRGLPEAIEFPPMKIGESRSQDMIYGGMPDGSVKVIGVSYDEKLFDVEYRRLPDNSYQFHVTSRGTLSYGPFSQKMIVHTNESESAGKSVMLKGQILRPTEFVPSTLAFGILAPGQSKIDNVVIYSPYDKPVLVKRVEIDPTWPFSYDVQQMDASRSRVHLSFNPPTDRKMSRIISGEIRVHVESEGIETQLQIPISAMIRGQ